MVARGCEGAGKCSHSQKKGLWRVDVKAYDRLKRHHATRARGGVLSWAIGCAGVRPHGRAGGNPGERASERGPWLVGISALRVELLGWVLVLCGAGVASAHARGGPKAH